MRHLLVAAVTIVLFASDLFGVDATLKIEKDVEHRARIALVDGSADQSSKVFNIFLSDLKISGHFIPDTTHHIGDISSNYILPALKGQEYLLKYAMDQRSGSKLLVRLLKSSDGSQIFKKSYAIPKKPKMPFLINKAVSDVNNVLRYPSIAWINRYVAYAVNTTPGRREIRLADYTYSYQKTIIKV